MLLFHLIDGQKQKWVLIIPTRLTVTIKTLVLLEMPTPSLSMFLMKYQDPSAQQCSGQEHNDLLCIGSSPYEYWWPQDFFFSLITNCKSRADCFFIFLAQDICTDFTKAKSSIIPHLSPPVLFISAVVWKRFVSCRRTDTFPATHHSSSPTRNTDTLWTFESLLWRLWWIILEVGFYHCFFFFNPLFLKKVKDILPLVPAHSSFKECRFHSQIMKLFALFKNMSEDVDCWMY